MRHRSFLHSALLIACALAVPALAETPAEVVDPDIIEKPGKEPAEVIETEPDTTEAAAGTPMASIAADGESTLGCWMMLDASASRDPKGEALKYEWKQTAGPKLPLARSDAGAKVWLFFTQPGEYRVALRAQNAVGWSRATEVRFTVKPGQPWLSENEGRRIAGAGERVLLPGEGWRQATGPTIDLRYDDGGMSFRPVLPGLYIFEAPRAGDVPERRGVVVPAGKDERLGDRRPLAEFLTRNPAGAPHKPLILDASLSRDPDGPEETQNLKARWITSEKHRGVELESLPGLKARFKAPRPGTYSVTLVVSDGRLDSDPPETVFIKVEGESKSAEGGVDPGWEEEPDYARDDIRYRSVRLGLFESTLDRAVQMFPSRCGVALRVDADFIAPEKLETIPLALEVQNGALMHLADWVARQSKGCYRREGDRALWLTHPLGWIKNEKHESPVVPVDELYKKPGAVDLIELIKPSFQQILDARHGVFTLGFEKNRQILTGVLPASAAAKLKQIEQTLRAPAEGLPPQEGLTSSEMKLRALLGEKRVSLNTGGRSLRIDYLLRNLAESSGLAISFDPRQFPNGLPRVELKITDAVLRDAVRTIVDAAGFDGCSVEAPAGLWFFRGAAPYPSSEMLWDQTFVQAYDISRLLAQVAPLSGEAIVYTIQQRIYPDSWKDPGALVFFHAPTRKLVVMHGPHAHRRVIDFLYDLRDRTEWALGVVDVQKK